MGEYVNPSLDLNNFTCPHCNTLAQQKKSSKAPHLSPFNNLFTFDEGSYPDSKRINIVLTTCQCCYKYHLWIDGKMLIPNVSNIPMPLDDMPNDIKELYTEASSVFPHSKKATAALLRLALQKLCIHLGGKGKSINDDIGSLVEKGLPKEVQMALDYVRVTGNNSVHPGEMNIEDNDDICIKLFSMLNFIVDRMIIQPKEIERAFGFLPEKARNAIEKRDSK